MKNSKILVNWIKTLKVEKIFLTLEGIFTGVNKYILHKKFLCSNKCLKI
jgi:hypothetical protein